jgi:hypothetical protein
VFLFVLFTSGTVTDARFATQAYILGATVDECTPQTQYVAILSGNSGVRAVSYSWTVSGDGTINGSATNQTVYVDAQRDAF